MQRSQADATIARLTLEAATAQAEVDRLTGAEAEAEAEIARLNVIIAAFQRHRFGARSEKLDSDQFELVLEELSAALARVKAGIDARAPAGSAARPRKINRGSLPAHLERVEPIVDIDDKTCRCCGSALHAIGEDVAERPCIARSSATLRTRAESLAACWDIRRTPLLSIGSLPQAPAAIRSDSCAIFIA